MHCAALRFLGGRGPGAVLLGLQTDYMNSKSLTPCRATTLKGQAIIRFEQRVKDHSTACDAWRQDASDGEELL